jgi:polar amino acid transport system permease protein
MNYTFQFGVVFARLPELWQGALLSLEIGALSFWGGALLGLLLAAFKVYGVGAVRWLANSFIVFFTNTPAVIQIYFLYYGLPELGVLWSNVTCVIVGLTLNTGAYLAEIMRAGFISVRRTELEAAETLGFARWQQIRHVILPHIAKVIYPALANYFVVLMLGTSMASIFGVNELTGQAYNIASDNYRHIEMFTVVAGIYIVLTFIASLSLALFGRWAFRVRARIF